MQTTLSPGSNEGLGFRVLGLAFRVVGWGVHGVQRSELLKPGLQSLGVHTPMPFGLFMLW